jgi:hypothetical protein
VLQIFILFFLIFFSCDTQWVYNGLKNPKKTWSRKKCEPKEVVQARASGKETRTGKKGKRKFSVNKCNIQVKE